MEYDELENLRNIYKIDKSAILSSKNHNNLHDDTFHDNFYTDKICNLIFYTKREISRFCTSPSFLNNEDKKCMFVIPPDYYTKLDVAYHGLTENEKLFNAKARLTYSEKIEFLKELTIQFQYIYKDVENELSNITIPQKEKTEVSENNSMTHVPPKKRTVRENKEIEVFNHYPDFKTHYDFLVENGYMMIENDKNLKWNKTKKSLAEYFNMIKPVNKNNKWKIIENLFDVKDLKSLLPHDSNAYGKIESEDFIELKEKLKIYL